MATDQYTSKDLDRWKEATNVGIETINKLLGGKALKVTIPTKLKAELVNAVNLLSEFK